MTEVPERIRKHLLLRENDSEVMYMDSTGNPTFGIGVKATSEEIDRWPLGTVVPEAHRNKRFEAHIATSYTEAIRKAKEIGQAGNQNLTDSFFHVNYQLGDNWERAPGRKGHRATWALIKQGRFEDAAAEAEKSIWFGQTPKRVRDFQAALMRAGKSAEAKRQANKLLGDPEFLKSYTQRGHIKHNAAVKRITDLTIAQVGEDPT